MKGLTSAALRQAPQIHSVSGNCARWLAAIAALTAVACAGEADPTSGPEKDAVTDVIDTTAHDTTAHDTTAHDSGADDVATVDAAVTDGAGIKTDGGGADGGEADAEDMTVADTTGCDTNSDCPTTGTLCTVNLCQPDHTCKLANSPAGTLCSDGKACTVGDECAAGACIAGPEKVCADDDDCTADSCAPQTGQCDNAPLDEGNCDDANPCTSADTCKAGTCVAGANVCECATDEDCAKQDDEDACNGSLFCDKIAHACKPNLATVINCSKAEDTACTGNVCDPKTGKCGLLAKLDATPCDDGVACTTGDSCKGGACTPGTQVCCLNDADCVDEDDGNACNGVLFCNKATKDCEFNPASVVVCQTASDTICRRNLCAPQDGYCKYVDFPDGKPCNDDNPCTGDDACSSGECTATTNVCECTKDADCAPKKGDNLCTGTLFCDKTKAKPTCELDPTTVVKCPSVDNTTCAQQKCAPLTGKCAWAPADENTPCDADGNACTPNDVCKAGKCLVGSNVCQCGKDSDCAVKEDGDLCNGTLFCDKKALPFVCVVNPATRIFCDAGNDFECAANTCAPKTGKCAMAPQYHGSQCDADSNHCTVADRCSFGECVAGANICKCEKDADCNPQEDGNPCNGTLFCDTNKFAHACAINPASVVTCTDNNDTCVDRDCAPASGKCALFPASQGHSCDDGEGCTGADACNRGKCIGDALECDDGNKCTTDSCDAKSQKCVHVLAAPTFCDDGAPCTSDSCIPAFGCVNLALPDEAKCKDGSACVQASLCDGGVCVAGKAIKCDDGNVCTNSACDLAVGCTATAANEAKSCGDGNACIGLACKSGVCASGAPKVCTAEDSCKIAYCDPSKGGCVVVPVGENAACDDGDACSVGDRCTSGLCKSLSARSCDDGNPCTANACDPKTGCTTQNIGDGKPCSDGTECTEKDACTGGKCSGSPLNCDDSNVCTDDSCDPKVGCLNAANVKACDDGDVCTATSACGNGKCTGVSKDCDDNNVCTTDTCDAKTGQCQHPAKDCSDGNACTDDSCNSVTGDCKNVGNTLGCDDKNYCSVGDSCANTACVAGAARVCTDANACTLDSCSKSLGKCVFTNSTERCDDGDACSSKDTCADGKCVGKSITCDDGDPCTVDACDKTAGVCVYKAAPEGAPCDGERKCHEGRCVWAVAVTVAPRLTTVASGVDHTCAIRDLGDVVCWGAATPQGELGPAVGKQSSGVVVPLTDGAVQIVAGDHHTCIVSSSDKVRCWGQGDKGQLGNGSTAATGLASEIPGISAVSTIAGGANHTCTLHKDGRVWCWGANNHGQLGDGTKLNRSAPTAVAGLTGVTDLAAGGDHTCAVANEQVWCWGEGAYGQLGQNSFADRVVPTVAANVTASRVALGTDFTCVLQVDRSLACFGRNHRGQLATPKFGSPSNTFQPQKNAATVAVTDACAAKTCDDGKPCTEDRCNPLTAACEHPVTPDGGACSATRQCNAGKCVWATDFAVGRRNTCARHPDGTASCWGFGSAVLGRQTTTSTGVPMKVDALADAVDLQLHFDTVCVRRTSTTAGCWGLNSYCALGGFGASPSLVTPLIDVEFVPDPVEIAAGRDMGCAIFGDGSAKCWGNRSGNRFGTSNVQTQCGAIPVDIGPNPAKLHVGYDFAGAIGKDGKLRLFGSNGVGQLGKLYSELKSSSVAIVIAGLSNVIAVDSSQLHICAVHDGGKVACWGTNAAGLVHTTTEGTKVTKSHVPLNHAHITNAVAVSVGDRFACALLQTGTVKCWGQAVYGTLGSGTSSSYSALEQAVGLTDVTAIDSGSATTCAMKADGSLWCWAQNSSGQVGAGTVGGFAATPAIVAGTQP